MIWLVIAAVTLCFGLVLFVGAPYLPSLKNQRRIALELLDLKKGQTLYDLGCGGGIMLIEAARRGHKAVGYELNPILFIIAWLHTWPHRKNIKVYWGDFWRANLSGADGVYVFLHSRFMSRLDKKLQGLARPIKLASYGFAIVGKKPAIQKAGIFLYYYL